jgi:hypothetical protein
MRIARYVLKRAWGRKSENEVKRFTNGRLALGDADGCRWPCGEFVKRFTGPAIGKAWAMQTCCSPVLPNFAGAHHTYVPQTHECRKRSACGIGECVMRGYFLNQSR